MRWEEPGDVTTDLALLLRKEMVTGAKDMIRYTAFDCSHVLAVDADAVFSLFQSTRTSNLYIPVRSDQVRYGQFVKLSVLCCDCNSDTISGLTDQVKTMIRASSAGDLQHIRGKWLL